MKRIVDSNFELKNLKISKNPSPYKNIILDYFNSHTQNAAFASSTIIDVVTGEDTRLPKALYDDGEYQWNSTFVYHFEKYNLKLNDDFIQHVLSNL